MFKGGAMDPDACRKVTSFLVLCDSFNIPIVFLVDTPGFLVGIEGERKAAPAHIMNMIHDGAAAVQRAEAVGDRHLKILSAL